MSDSKQFHILGAGGHAKVIIRAIESLGQEVAAVFDDDQQTHGTRVLDIEVIGLCSKVQARKSLPSIVAVGDNSVRKKLAEQFALDWHSVIHPAAIVDKTVTIGRGSVVMAGAIIQPGSVIGEHCIINTSATIDHDCVVGDYSHVAPGAHLAGHCWLDEGVLVGIGGSLIPSIRIGQWTKVGAGAAVVRDLPPYAVAMGVPAVVCQ